MSKPALQKHLYGIMGPQDDTSVGHLNLARVKQCARKDPARMRLLGSKRSSRSHHEPPLVARCNECFCWFPFSVRRNGWISCHERQVLCDSEDFSVSCFKCNQVAVYVPSLESWYCSVCIQEAEKLLRAVRYRPARYGQSAMLRGYIQLRL